MSNSSFTVALALAATALASSAAPAAAQGFASIGLGQGNIQLTCDSSCEGDSQSAGGAYLALGRGGDRGRFELLGHFYRHRGDDDTNYVYTATAGLSLYVVNNLFVRGGAGLMSASFADVAGSYEASGYPLWLYGAGYDLRSDDFGLTIFVTRAQKSFDEVKMSGLNGAASTMKGKASLLAFGAALTFF